MKNILTKFVVGTLPFALLLSSHAAPISGDIGFTGNVSFDAPIGTATEITGYSLVFVTGGSQSGSYSAVPDYTWADWTPFVFNPPAASVIPLWTFTLGGITYSFDATSIVVQKQIENELLLTGTGVASITGYDNTPGTWTFNAGGPGTLFSFTAGTSVRAPDGGATIALLGLGLVAMSFLQTRIGRAQVAK